MKNAFRYGNSDEYVNKLAGEVQCKSERACETNLNPFGTPHKRDVSGISATFELAEDG